MGWKRGIDMVEVGSMAVWTRSYWYFTHSFGPAPAPSQMCHFHHTLGCFYVCPTVLLGGSENMLCYTEATLPSLPQWLIIAEILRQIYSWETGDSSHRRFSLRISQWPCQNFLRTALQSRTLPSTLSSFSPSVRIRSALLVYSHLGICFSEDLD